MSDTVREELLRLIRLNHQEQWPPADVALEQLQHFGTRLIPALIEATDDSDPDVRLVAISLLNETRTRSDAVIAALVRKLTDTDHRVRVEAAYGVGRFRPLGVSAIPILESWLTDDLEIVRVLAMTTILRLDPCRSEFLPEVHAAAESVNPTVADLAKDYLDEQSPQAMLRRAVERHWNHHSMSVSVSWNCDVTSAEWYCEAAPAFQEVFGGRNDGERVWAGFHFDLSGFAREPGVQIDTTHIESRCLECSETPGVRLWGRFHGQPFVLRLHQEPSPDSEPTEILDTINGLCEPAREAAMSNVINATDDTFKAEVIESPLPVLVDFYADHCGPCRQLAPILKDLADEIQGRAKVVKVNAQENPGLSLDHGIGAVPTLIVFRGGEEIRRLVGLQSKESLLNALGLTA